MVSGTRAVYFLNILGRIAYDVEDVLRKICPDYSYERIYRMNREKVTIVLLAAAFGLLFAPAVQACNVPVFRFALERWVPDRYEVVVVHSESTALTADQQKAIQTLQTLSDEKEGATNIRLHRVSLGKTKMSKSLQALWDSQPDATKANLPAIVVAYPFSQSPRSRDGVAILQTAWAAPLSMQSAEAVIGSPLRKAIAQKIVDGATAVWIFREGKDTAANEKAYAELQKQLTHAEKTIKLPDLDAEETKKVNLRVNFAIVRLTQAMQKTEAFLNASLLHSEPGEEPLTTCADQPMAFPVFGRGRVLYALVGRGISEENVLDTCAFLIGPCGCQVKADNPGWDMLLTMKWDDHIQDTLVKDEDITDVELMGLPQVPSLTVAPAPASTEPQTAPLEEQPMDDTLAEGGLPPLWIGGIVAAALLGVAWLVGEIIRRKKS